MGHIIIQGRIPSKKNSTWTVMVRGRAIRLPSQKYKEWNNDAKQQLIGQDKIPNGSHLVLHFYMPDKRRADLTNKAESIMDTLVDSGLLEDDSYQIIPNLMLEFMGIDKENPRCEVFW
jgi:Holliday junction resolvase RusA-like endonuclease